MKHVVQLENGTFVSLRIQGDTKYYPSVLDPQDAYDFESELVAKRWLAINKKQGEVLPLSDDGYWPVED